MGECCIDFQTESSIKTNNKLIFRQRRKKSSHHPSCSAMGTKVGISPLPGRHSRRSGSATQGTAQRTADQSPSEDPAFVSKHSEQQHTKTGAEKRSKTIPVCSDKNQVKKEIYSKFLHQRLSGRRCQFLCLPEDSPSRRDPSASSLSPAQQPRTHPGTIPPDAGTCRCTRNCSGPL